MSSRRGGGELDAVRTRDLAALDVTPEFPPDQPEGRALVVGAIAILTAFVAFLFAVYSLVVFVAR